MENISNPFAKEYQQMFEILTEAHIKFQVITNPEILHIKEPISTFLLQKIRFLNYRLGNSVDGTGTEAAAEMPPLKTMLGRKLPVNESGLQPETKVD